jgi:hypothetical protein
MFNSEFIDEDCSKWSRERLEQEYKKIKGFEKKYKIFRENLPEKFFQLLELEYRIIPSTCACGGKLAWLDKNNGTKGCVCHSTPI